MVKGGAVGNLITMLLGLVGITWAQLDDRITGNTREIKTLDEKIDDIHWYLIRSKNVQIKKDSK